MPRRFISAATWAVSSSDGVIEPEADDVHAMFRRRLQNVVAGDHDAEVDNVVAVAAEDDADDVLADVGRRP